jgi:hypothetical protein
MQKCEICGASFADSDGKRLSPRDFSRLEPKVADTTAVTLHSMASSIIMFNNPPGAADSPMWWICSNCLSRCFSAERSRASVQMESALFQAITGSAGAQAKKWWQFWK